MAKYQIKKARLHISKGNTKIGKGIYSFSTLPGNKKHMIYANGELLTDVPGTCTKHCENCANACYAFSSAKLHHNAVIPAWAENTLLLRSGKLKDEVDKYITKKNKNKVCVKTLRVHVSGEIRSEKDIEMWNELAKLHPETVFSTYTKNYEAVDKFMQTHKNTESNFVINISQWHGCANKFLAKYPGKFNVFTYNDANLKNNGLSEKEVEALAKLPKCPAVTKEGKHAKDKNGNPILCENCMRCYRKTGKETAVWAH